MEYLLVKIPTIKIIPPRRAETGQELAAGAYGRNDQLLCEPGETIEPEDLDRFDNFGVRSLVVHGYQKRWLPEDEDIPAGGEVVERKQFSNAVSGFIESMDDFGSIKQLVDMCQYLRRKAMQAGRSDFSEELKSLQNRAEDVVSDYEFLETELEDVTEAETVDEIKKVLFDSTATAGEQFMQLSAPAGVLNKSVKAANQRDEITDRLIEIASQLTWIIEEDDEDQKIDKSTFENKEMKKTVALINEGYYAGAIEHLFESEVPPGKSHDLEENVKSLQKSLAGESETAGSLHKELTQEIDNPSAKKSLLNTVEGTGSINPKTLSILTEDEEELSERVNGLLEKRFQNREQLWETLDELSDGKFSDHVDREQFLLATREAPAEEERWELSDELFREVERLLDAGRFVKPIEILVEAIENSPLEGRDIEGELIVIGEEFEELRKRRAEIEGEIDEEVDDRETQQQLLELLNQREGFKSDELLGIDANMMILEKVDTFKTDELNKISEFRDTAMKLKTSEVV